MFFFQWRVRVKHNFAVPCCLHLASNANGKPIFDFDRPLKNTKYSGSRDIPVQNIQSAGIFQDKIFSSRNIPVPDAGVQMYHRP